MDNFKEYILTEFKRFNIKLDDKQSNLFLEYMKNLVDWNSRINLTAIKDEKEIVLKHFIDCSCVLDKIQGKKILDVGSGAGFPGLPLKIMNNDFDVTLIDSVNKKVNFLNDTIDKLNLNDIEAFHVRAEELAFDKDYREKFDTVVSRAVANMTTLVEYMLPFAKVGGRCICLKGPNVEDELNDSKHAIEILGGKIEEVFKYKIDNNDRCLVVISKIKNTEHLYPRKQGKPLKEPIK